MMVLAGLSTKPAPIGFCLKKRKKEKNKMPFYVSQISEYPIYEAAEGGYYYAGTSVDECIEFSSWKKANKYFQKLRKEFLAEYEFYGELDRVHDFCCGGVGKYVNPCVMYNSRYIGDGARIELTRKKPVEHGWTPYC